MSAAAAAGRPVLIAPSLLASDFANLENEIRRAEEGGADWLHLDIMDGHFVPNLTIGPPVVASIGRVAQKPLDCHLMIDDPWAYAGAFVDEGAAGITIHLEVCERRPEDARRLLDELRAGGVRPGIALKPDRDVRDLAPFLDHVDLILRMSVYPGFGGQKFMPEVLDGVRTLRGQMGYRGHVQMDGGIDLTTIGQARAAGVDVFVAGTAVFGKVDAPFEDLGAQIRALRDAANGE